MADCNRCQIMAAWTYITQYSRYNSSIGITLDTVSVAVTKYNNTSITRSSTEYGDTDSVNVSTVAEVQSIKKSLSGYADSNYGFLIDVFRGNATEGERGNYTNYLAIDGYQYISLPLNSDGSVVGEVVRTTYSCTMQSVARNWVELGELPNGYTVSPVSLTSTYYQSLGNGLEEDFGILNVHSFSDFLASVSVFEGHPELRPCAVYSAFNGPPRVVIPVSVLTETVETTIAGLGSYNPESFDLSNLTIHAPYALQPAAELIGPQPGQAAPVPVPSSTPAAPVRSSPEAPSTSSKALGSLAKLLAEEPPEQAGQPSPSQGLNPILTFGGSTYTADQLSNIVLSGQTIHPGSAAATVDNTPISIAPGGLAAVVGTSTQLLATLSSPAVLNFGGSAYTADASSNIVLAGSTLRAGGSPVVVSGTTVSLVPGGAAAVIGTHTQVFGGPTPTQGLSNTVQNVPHLVPATPVLTFEGSKYTANAASQFVVAGQTVTPGGVIKISNTPISIAPDATLAVIGSSTQSLVGSAITPQPVLTFAGSTYTAGTSSDFLINGQTMSKGGTINIGGTELSFGQAGTYVIIGTSTQQLQTPSVTAISEPILTFDGSTYTAGSLSDFVIDGQTLTRGGIIDVHGTQLSYGQDGTKVVIGTSTQELGTTSITVAEKSAITFDGSTYLADSASNFVIDGQTLSRGGTINVDGTQLSYGQDGKDVVIGTSMEGVGLGGYIMSGFSGRPTSTSPVAFTGRAARRTPAAGVLCMIWLGLGLYVAS